MNTMNKAISAMPATPSVGVGAAMGDWLLKLWAPYAAEQGLDPPDEQPSEDSSAPVAEAQPVPMPALPPQSGMTFNGAVPVPQAPERIFPPEVSGMTFNANLPQPKEISPQEEAVATNAADDALGKTLSGIQAMQPRGVDSPGAPGVPGTRAVDANVSAIIQALMRTGAPKQLSNTLR